MYTCIYSIFRQVFHYRCHCAGGSRPGRATSRCYYISGFFCKGMLIFDLILFVYLRKEHGPPCIRGIALHISLVSLDGEYRFGDFFDKICECGLYREILLLVH